MTGGQRARLLGVLALPFLFLFRTVLAGDEALYARDVFHQYWPLRTHVVQALAEGHLPLWDDGSQGGLPLLANIHAAALYPPNFIYQLVPFQTGYGWLVVLHLVVLAWGVFAWLSAMGRGTVAASVAGIAFAASGPVLGLSAFGPNLMGLAWVPWFAHALVRKGDFVSRLAQAAMVVALQCLCGDPMSVLFSALLGAVIVGWAPRRRPLVIMGSVSAAIGVMLAGAQLLPAAGLLAQTTRLTSGDQLDWSMHRARFLELFLPKLFGNFEGTPAFWGAFLAIGEIKTPFSLSVYAGAGVQVLALLGLRTQTRSLGLTLFVVGAVLALGSQFVAGPLLAHVPPFSLFRYPEKYLALAVLGLAVLAADGLELLATARASKAQSLAIAGLILTAGGVGATLRFSPGSWRPWLTATWPDVPSEIPLASFELATVAFASIAAVVLACAWLNNAFVRQGAVALIVITDLVIANQALVWTAPVELFTEQPPAIEAMITGAPERPFRVWRDNVAMAKLQFATQTPEQRMMQRAFDLLTLKSSLATVFGVQELSGNSPVVLSRWSALIQATRAHPGAMLKLYNTCFVITPVTPGERIFAPMPEGVAVKRVDCLPRLFSVPHTLGVATQAEALAAVSSAAFEVTTTAVVEGGQDRRELDRVEVSDLVVGRGFARATLKAGSKGGFVVFGTSWAKGWAARIDGHEAPLFVVDEAVMGAEVAEGPHVIEFEFHEPLLAAGAALSALGALLLGGLVVGRRRLENHPFVS